MKHRRSRVRTGVAAACLGLVYMAGIVPGSARAEGSGSATLDAVRARGVLLCGTSGVIAGFALPDSKGVMRGMDADSCRAVAAAVLGDAEKVRFVPLTTVTRFTAVQSGEVDVLLRNAGWSLTREAALGLMFASVNYWGGAAFIVKTSSGVKSAKELSGATICVLPGTSTETILADWFRAEKMTFTPVEIDGTNELDQAFLFGRCDSLVTDDSQLAAFRFQQEERKSELTILPERISSEPVGAVVRKGDDKWFDILRWVNFALISAENLGVTSKNIAQFAHTTDPETRRLLGIEGNLGGSLGLDNSWASKVITQVGNYGELWERNVTPLGLDRGQNALWTKGGLAFSPPFR